MWSECSYCTTKSPTRRRTRSTPSSAGRFPGATFRHGKVFGSPMGEPAHRYYAEWEFAGPGRRSRRPRRQHEFMATGKDAYKRGFPQPTVEFVSLD